MALEEPRDPVVEAFRRLCDREGGWRVVAAAIDTNPQSLYQVYSGVKLPSGRPKGIGPEVRRRLVKQYGEDWAEGAAQPGLPLSSHQSNERGGKPSVDHRVSYQEFDHPLLTRELLMTMGKNLPARFTFALEDDAMGEHGRAGTEVLFHAAGAAKVGAGVLVRDKAGALHVRRKAQGRSEAHWLGVAPNGVYRTLDSEQDGLQILAVWRGVVNRGLEDL